MKYLLIALSIIIAPLAATAQWIPDYSSPQYQQQQQMLEQQRQQTAAQQQVLMEMQNQRMQQQQQYFNNNCLPTYEPRRPLGSFIDGFNAGRCRR